MKADATRDRDGRTALHYAAFEGQVEAIERLIREGADVDAQDDRGYTPLHFAAQEFRVDAARALIDAGASLAARDAYGNTALWTATFNSRGRGELVTILLTHGADPDSPNNSGASPRTAAAMIANYDVAQFFGGNE